MTDATGGTPVATRTAVVVVVSAASAAVDQHRAQLDRAASWGVPPHVTVLYPFVPPAEIDDGDVAKLRAAARSLPAFDVTFARTAWFDEDVVYLAPEPAEPFRRLTRAVHEAFPLYPPYGGEFDDLAPHLTVGQLGTVDQRRAAEAAVQRHLPLTTRVDHLTLLAGSDAPMSWRVLHELPLA
jgi:2'-5' RNA ligase